MMKVSPIFTKMIADDIDYRFLNAKIASDYFRMMERARENKKLVKHSNAYLSQLEVARSIRDHLTE